MQRRAFVIGGIAALAAPLAAEAQQVGKIYRIGYRRDLRATSRYVDSCVAGVPRRAS
jgi:hypothetical protein